jgi:hypothetical protein
MKTFPIENIDLSEVDIGNDFRDFPQIFSQVSDIEDFIEFKNLDLPMLKGLLKYRRENKLYLTPTESKFYFDDMFDYIYDVYRVPVEETYKNVEKWLEHLESQIASGGLHWIINTAYETVTTYYRSFKSVNQILKKKIQVKIINYYSDIGIDSKELGYYIHIKPEIIEQFWIKSSNNMQPVDGGDEAYMRVIVYPDRVFIFGSDDCSWTYKALNEEDSKEFANFLKTAAPVWNFGYTNVFIQSFGGKFEFTN